MQAFRNECGKGKHEVFFWLLVYFITTSLSLNR